MHTRVGQDRNESFARRLARDAHVAQQRHDRYLAEAAKRPKWEWLKAMVFFVLAVGAAVLFFWLNHSYDFMSKNPAVFALLLGFVMVVAGVGAGVVKWKQAATVFFGFAQKIKNEKP
jgi:membrane protein YdbS with pleckstrin-like domain